MTSFINRCFAPSAPTTPVPASDAPIATVVGAGAYVAADSFVAATTQKLAHAQAAAKTALDFVEQGAARAAIAIKTGSKSGREAAALMRPRNQIAAITKGAVASAERALTIARFARAASVAFAAVDLVQVGSDNPDYAASLKREEEAAKATGQWGCESYGFIQVCGNKK